MTVVVVDAPQVNPASLPRRLDSITPSPYRKAEGYNALAAKNQRLYRSEKDDNFKTLNKAATKSSTPANTSQECGYNNIGESAG
jgi:hypothetical protein